MQKNVSIGQKLIQVVLLDSLEEGLKYFRYVVSLASREHLQPPSLNANRNPSPRRNNTGTGIRMGAASLQIFTSRMTTLLYQFKCTYIMAPDSSATHIQGKIQQSRPQVMPQ